MTNTAVLRGEQPVSASAVKAARSNSETPRKLSEHEVEKIIKDFGSATKRAIKLVLMELKFTAQTPI